MKIVTLVFLFFSILTITFYFQKSCFEISQPPSERQKNSPFLILSNWAKYNFLVKLLLYTFLPSPFFCHIAVDTIFLFFNGYLILGAHVPCTNIRRYWYSSIFCLSFLSCQYPFFFQFCLRLCINASSSFFYLSIFKWTYLLMYFLICRIKNSAEVSSIFNNLQICICFN